MYHTNVDTKNFVFDENYNISLKEEGSAYDDLLSEIIGKLLEARASGEVNEAEFRVLARTFIKKAIKKDVQGAAKFIAKPRSRKKSLFFSYSEFKRSYAS